jgi:hypothetical protein
VEAMSLFRTAVAFFDGSRKDDISGAIAHGLYGECLTTLGRYDDAERQLTPSFDRMIKFGRSHLWAQQAIRRLADLYRRSGQPIEQKKYEKMLVDAVMTR